MAREVNYQIMDEDIDEPAKGFAREIYEWVESLCGAGMVLILVLIFILRVATVEGSSMVPTLQPADTLIFSDFGYTPAVDDIVIIDSDQLGKFIVKRVIATAGQRVEISVESGEVKVDGVVVEVPGVDAPTLPLDGGMTYPAVVPPDCIFVLGDNRLHSTDSRSNRVGFVPLQSVYGKVNLRLFPLTQMRLFD
jgi:signal peptidase I